MLISIIRDAFSAPKLPKNVEQRRKAAVKSVVAQRSHGNIRLQKGKMYTTTDIDEQYERIKHKKFCNA